MGVGLLTFRATLEYDGTDFSGWQSQPGRRTVQGEVEGALARILGARVPVLAAGRTDAGVHAAGQVISFRAATGIPADRLARGLNALLPPDAAVLSLEEAGPGFHATLDAAGKVYRYEIVDGGPRRPSLRRTSWWIPGRLDLAAMRKAAAPLVGRHDFRSFRTNPGLPVDAGSTVRTLLRADVRRRAGRVTLEFEGDGFLHNMVRNLVGTLVQVGKGAWPPGRVSAALGARDRRAAGPAAPPRGLTLVSVSYDSPPRRRRGGRKRKKMSPASAGARRIAPVMNVRFTGRHVGIPAGDRAWAEEKVEALGRFHRRLADLEVRVMMDGSSLERVELEARSGRNRIVSVGEAHSFREALDDALDSLRRQLLKVKEKVVARRRRPARRSGATGAGGPAR